ncbi:MAG: hypothetical protein R3C05_08590 [Pirellulaceae bacterium]
MRSIIQPTRGALLDIAACWSIIGYSPDIAEMMASGIPQFKENDFVSLEGTVTAETVDIDLEAQLTLQTSVATFSGYADISIGRDTFGGTFGGHVDVADGSIVRGLDGEIRSDGCVVISIGLEQTFSFPLGPAACKPIVLIR